jgi:putative hydrolase of HD superfamily
MAPTGTPDRLDGILEFLRAAERLKVMTRSAYTTAGEKESVAEHTWRLCLMALVLRDHFPEVDQARLLAMCLVHDLGEAIGGDVPAPEQVRRRAQDPMATKATKEREDLLTLVAPLPEPARGEIVSLWDEYEAASSPEARLAKSLDKLETILQHTQGDNPPDFDYRFNLGYGRSFTRDHPVIVALRERLDRETARLAEIHEGLVRREGLSERD